MKPSNLSILQQFRQWLRGESGLEEERQLESAATDDPFLRDALEGYRQQPEEDHHTSIQNLKAKIENRVAAPPRKRPILILLRVASVAAFIAAGSVVAWWLFSPDPFNEEGRAAIAQQEFREQPEEESPAPARPSPAPSPPIPAPSPEPEPPPEELVAIEDTAQVLSDESIAGFSPVEEREAEVEPSQPPASALSRSAFKAALPEALPEGGWTIWEEFISQNQRMPDEAKAANIEGQVGLAFTVEADSTIHRVEVVDSLGFGCENEAIRLLLEGPSWVLPPGLDSLRTRLEIPFPAAF